MKYPILFFLYFCSYSFFSYAQEISSAPGGSSSSYVASAELLKYANVPNSPEAQAFEVYGNTPVNLYYGQPSIEIPLYTHKGREVNMPVSIDYDASGIKVDQLATQVGLGWNLHVGGRISRIVNGLPDDYYGNEISQVGRYKSFWDGEVSRKILEFEEDHDFYSFPSEAAAYQHLRFLKKMHLNEYETQLDYFSLNAMGVSETIVIDVASKQAIALNNPKIRVSYGKANVYSALTPIHSWEITLDDGTKLYFEQAEKTHSVTRNYNSAPIGSVKGNIQIYNSSWLLTRLESPRGKDIYKFSYVDLGYWNDFRAARDVSSKSNQLSSHPGGAPGGTSPGTVASTIDKEYMIRQKFLSQIHHNGALILDVALKNRCDIGINSAIESLYVYNSQSSLLKSFDFDYDYFRTSNSVSPCSGGTSYDNVRLKLDALIINDKNEEQEQRYSFVYKNPNQMPPINSKARDYYNYFNGKTRNTTLHPNAQSIGYLNPPGQSNNGSLNVVDGADRRPYPNYAVYGMLERINYPTGGYSYYEYEGNSRTRQAGEEDTIIGWDFQNEMVNTATTASYDSGCDLYVTVNGVEERRTPKMAKQFLDVSEETTYRFTQNNGDHSLEYIADEWLSSANSYLFEIVKVSENGGSSVFLTCIIELPGGPTIPRVYQSNINKTPSTTFTATLTPGRYELIIRNPFETRDLSLKIELGITTPEAVFQEQKKAGVRIKEIIDFTDEGIAAFKRSYSYRNGKIISEPRYHFISREIFYFTGRASQQYSNPVGGGQPQLGSKYFINVLHRLSGASGTDRPHIGYGEVTERIISNNGSENGYTIHTFYTGDEFPHHKSGLYSNLFLGTSSPLNYGLNYKIGKPKQIEIFSQSDVLQSKVSNQYSTIDFYERSVIYARNNPSLVKYYPTIYQNADGSYRIDPSPMEIRYRNLGLGFSNDHRDLEYYTDFPSNHVRDPSLLDPALVTTTLGRTFITGSSGNMSIRRESIFYDEESYTTSTHYDYYNEHSVDDIIEIDDTLINSDDSFPALPQNNSPVISQGFNLLKTEKTIDSNGDALITNYRYPHNFATTEHQTLKSKNILSTPVLIETYKNQQKLFAKRTHYNGIQPSHISVAKGENDLENRLIFERYVNNNLVQGRQKDGRPVTYIYGYDSKYVIAKIDNITYNEVEALTSFGNNFTITENFNSTQLSDLRTSFPNAQITSYTYDPDIGITSQTDPRGYSMYYEYDDQNRLKYVKDQDGNILTKNEYNFRTNN